MSEPTLDLPPRRWLVWIAPAVVLTLAVLLWFRQIDRNGWCIDRTRRGDEVHLDYTAEARWGLLGLSIAAGLAAAVAVHRLVRQGVGHRHPALMAMFCVAVALVVYWLVELHGVWADSVTLGPDSVRISQTQWLIGRSRSVRYRAVRRVALNHRKWVFFLDNGDRIVFRPTPLLRAARRDVLAKLPP